MQWLIDIVFEMVMQLFTGIIVIWSGTLDNIPDGWALCDGNNGTPDLTDKFVFGADVARPPGETGGAFIHTHLLFFHKHTFTGDGHTHGTVPHDHDIDIVGHFHDLHHGDDIAAGSDLSDRTGTTPLAGTTYPKSPDTDEQSAIGSTDFGKSAMGTGSNIPPYYALAYIMKL